MTEITVLVVDDEPNVVRLCQRLLERTQYQILTAYSSGLAIEILQTQHVDLLIADIRMPGLDGLQLIDRARQFLPDLAAILMTGYGTLETAIAALQKGVDGLILKPFSGIDFIQNAKLALEKRQRKNEMLRLQALKPLLELSETLFPLRDQDLLVDTLLKEVHRILANDLTALVGRESHDLPNASLQKQDRSWQVIRSLGELFPANGQPIEDRLAHIPDFERWEPAIITMAQDFPSGWPADGTGAGQLPLLFVPIPVKNQQLAIVGVRSGHRELYTQSDLEMLIVLARQSAVAFENARLFTELTNSLNRIEFSRTALLQTERLAAAGRLTASIAHEINNPLQALQNCLDLVARKDLEEPQRQKYLDYAISELNRLMTTVDRMLAFYRPIARDRKLVDLNDVIRRAIELLQPQFVESAIIVHSQLNQESLPIMAVASQLQQVFFNLLINSMEAMTGGGEIWITSKAILGAERESAEILIEDNGPGIHGEQLERLFEPLVSSKPNGTGLGLAVSYGIIEAHGGTLKLISGSRHGACFQIVLPEE